LILLAASVFVVAFFKKLNLSPVLGYFVAGAAIGRYGLNIVPIEETSLLSEFGVIFLLFAIGLELTFERLKAMRFYVFGFGTAQVLITSAAIAAIAYFFVNNNSSVTIIGGGLALSSTAIVLQVIAENRQQSTQVGRLSLATLIMQDFAVVPLLVLIPLLTGDKTHMFTALSISFGKAAIALAGIFILGRLFLRPLFKMITSTNPAKTNELFIATTLLIALGTARCTEYMGLSYALGAFVAGLLVAETEFHIQAEESINPFKGLFLGLFFMTVGMEINLALIVDKIGTIALWSVMLILVKSSIITALCLVFRFNAGTAIHTGLILAQGSEFAFIMFELATVKGIIDKELGQMLLLVVTVTMALTPLLSIVGNYFASKLEKDKVSMSDIYREISDLDNHVIIIGFGRVGKMVSKLLEAENTAYIAIDIESDNVSEGRKEGFPIYLGDGSDINLLKSLGADRARSVIITVDNEVTSKKTCKIININYPNLIIVVRSKDLSNSEELYKSGAKIIVPETYETGLQLGGAVLKSIGISEFEVNRIKNQFRAGNYVMAKELEDSEEVTENYDYMGNLISFDNKTSLNKNEENFDEKK
jgi:CPA2 family monovalent cation:H+ antiporter-2